MMRLSLIRSSAVATVAAIALAACANLSGMTPSSPTAAAGAQNTLGISHLLTTCATSPPQYEWIFKGACDESRLEPSGGHFRLSQYQGISVKEFIGANALKRPAKLALADAIDENGDVERYKGMSFPRYIGEGTTYVYLTTTNRSTQTITFVTVKGKPVFEFVITDAEGFGSYTKCGLAALFFPQGKPRWLAVPNIGTIKSKTVKLSVYAVPAGFGIQPKIPLYVAINCFS
jgi:hypothetical protein